MDDTRGETLQQAPGNSLVNMGNLKQDKDKALRRDEGNRD